MYLCMYVHIMVRLYLLHWCGCVLIELGTKMVSYRKFVDEKPVILRDNTDGDYY